MDSFTGFSSQLRPLLNRDISKRALNSKFLSDALAGYLGAGEATEKKIPTSAWKNNNELW